MDEKESIENNNENAVQIDNEKEPIKNNQNRIKYMAIGLGIVAIIIILSIPVSVTVPYQKLETYYVPYADREAYQTQVPYQETEYYTEKEPYNYTQNVDTSVPYNVEMPYDSSITRVLTGQHYTYTQSLGGLINTSHINTDFYFAILNNEKQAGTFRVTAILSPSIDQASLIGMIIDVAGLTQGIPGVGTAVKSLIPKQGELKMSGQNDIPASSEDYIKITVPGQYIINSGNYELLSPIKTVTQYRTSPETKEFTDYRDVQKSRIVTKYRMETQYRDVIKQRPANRYVQDYKQETVWLWQKIIGTY